MLHLRYIYIKYINVTRKLDKIYIGKCCYRCLGKSPIMSNRNTNIFSSNNKCDQSTPPCKRIPPHSYHINIFTTLYCLSEKSQ